MIAPETVSRPESRPLSSVSTVSARQLGGCPHRQRHGARSSPTCWALAVTIEDGNITDVDKALRAAQEALKQGAGARRKRRRDQEAHREPCAPRLDNFMRQPRRATAQTIPSSWLGRSIPIPRRAAPAGSQQHDRAHGAAVRAPATRDAARQLLEQLAADAGKPANGAARSSSGDDEMEQALNELGDMIRKATAVARQDLQAGPGFAARSHAAASRGDQSMGDLQQDQDGLRERLKKLQQELCQGAAWDRASAARRVSRGSRARTPSKARARTASAKPIYRDGAMPAASSAKANADGAVDFARPRAWMRCARAPQSLAPGRCSRCDEGQGDGPGNRVGPAAERLPTAPIRSDGRCAENEYSDDYSVKIPGEIDVQRVRRILEELRRPPLPDPQRPPDRHSITSSGLLKDYLALRFSSIRVSSPAKAGDPVFQRRWRSDREGRSVLHPPAFAGV